MQVNSINDELRQPAGLRWAMYANILLWGVQLPFGAPALNVLITLAAGLLHKTRHKRVPLSLILFSLCLLGYGVITFLAGPCTEGAIKVVISLIVMILIFLSIYWLAASARSDCPLLSTQETTWLLVIITCAALVEYAARLLGGTPISEIRVGGVYLEPSHLALSGVPLFCYLFFCGTPVQKWLGITAAFVLLVVGYSSTLIILLIAIVGLPYLGSLARRPMQRSGLLVLAGLVSAPLLVLMSPASEDTLLRITDTLDLREESNLSSLVYANGWMMLDYYLNSTAGLGLGFNAMGCEPRAVTLVTGWLELLDLGDQNYNDGSFLLSKIGSEFGMVGVLGFIVMVGLSLKQLLGLLKHSLDATAVVCTSWIAIVFVGGVVRSGGGYFSGPVLLGILAFFVLKQRKLSPSTEDLPDLDKDVDGQVRYFATNKNE
jgi:hypothetical protein